MFGEKEVLKQQESYGATGWVRANEPDEPSEEEVEPSTEEGDEEEEEEEEEEDEEEDDVY